LDKVSRPFLNKVVTHYADPRFEKMVDLYKLRQVKGFQTSEDMPLPVTLEMLKARNQLFTITPDGAFDHMQTQYGNAGADEILISSGFEVTTNAGACLSYIFRANDPAIAAAVHVNSRHVADVKFHAMMISLGITTLRALAPKADISAYISGGYALQNEGYTEESHQRVAQCNRILIDFMLSEMHASGVRVEELNFGDDFKKQTLRVGTGEYETV
jgi:hypothetical protein